MNRQDREADITLLGAARDVGPIVRLGYGSLRRTLSGHSPVIVAENGCDAEGLSFLRAQPWIKLVTLADRLAEADDAYDESAAVLESTWTAIASNDRALDENDRKVLRALKSMVSAQRPPAPEDAAQLGETVDQTLTYVSTRYAVLVDTDVEFTHVGWLSDIVELMDDRHVDLMGFLEPARHPIQERFATYVLAMRVAPIRSLNCSFATSLTFGDAAERTRWYGQPHHRYLDTTAFRDYPSARFYDTAARVYHAALERGMTCREFPSAWRSRFHHLGHMAWSGDVDGTYRGSDDLHAQRRMALSYAETRCRALGFGER